MNRHSSPQSISLIRLRTSLFFLAAFILLPAHTQDNPPAATPEIAAVAAMESWLKVIDDGQYEQSWNLSSAYFQKKVPTAKWSDALNSVRMPLGKLLNRQVAVTLHRQEIPDPESKSNGTLKGDYVIAQFNASFENLKSALETVTFEKESDGHWRASGYYIKPN